MFDEELSKFFSDDGKRESTIFREDNMLKVVFQDTISKMSFFKYYNSIASAENAAEDFVMYEAS